MARIHWLDILIAPLTWLERTRGRRRLALLLLYGLILAVGGVLVGREVVLWRLPDAPEPFDLVKYGHVDLPDADNAIGLYRRADEIRVKNFEPYQAALKKAGYSWRWTQNDPAISSWIEENRAALDVWLAASRLPDFLFLQPEEFAHSVPPSSDAVFDGLFALNRLGTLEATRRQSMGDLDGAWTYYRAVIRSALHMGRSGGGLSGNILQRSIPAVRTWVEEAGMTSALLRQAVADLAECRGLELTNSAIIRAKYFATRSFLGERDEWDKRQLDSKRPDFWPYYYPAVLRTKYFFDHEPERSRTILRLITAGQLAQCDRPHGDRPPLVSSDYLIYDIDAATPSAVARIRPAQLAAWADASGCRGALPDLGDALASNERSRNMLDQLRIRLAERAFAVDHGGQPAQTYGDLFPTYLDAFPAGVMSGDRLTAP